MGFLVLAAFYWLINGFLWTWERAFAIHKSEVFLEKLICFSRALVAQLQYEYICVYTQKTKSATVRMGRS
jgi:hypothetical protein